MCTLSKGLRTRNHPADMPDKSALDKIMHSIANDMRYHQDNFVAIEITVIIVIGFKLSRSA